MTKKLELYKCEICGNLVEVIQEGIGELVCCGQEMKLQTPQTQDEWSEKHVPFVEKTKAEGKQTIKIQVGEIEHPMEENHFIRFIEVVSDDEVYLKRKMLKPNEKPILEFECNCNSMLVREYCNIHGLWQKKVN